MEYQKKRNQTRSQEIEYRSNIFPLVLKNGGITVPVSDKLFDSDYSSDTKKVLIYAPERTSSEKINRLISELPINEDYSVIVDMNETPLIMHYSDSRVDVIINTHEDPNGDFRTKVEEVFHEVDYLDSTEFLDMGYETILAKIKEIKPSKKGLEGVVLSGEAV